MSIAKRISGYIGIALALILVAILVMVIFRLTDALQVFSFNSNSNEPTIPRGRIVFTSNLKEPARFDFISFNNRSQPGSAWLSRICGMPGDSVEIRNGDLYVNGKAVDSLFTLSHSYIIPIKDTIALKLPAENPSLVISEENALVVVPDNKIKNSGIPYNRYVLPAEVTDAQVQKTFGEEWNIDNFGPVAVPKDSYFLLCDSRTGAIDSRYIGFVNKKDFRGTLLFYHLK